MFDVRRIAGRTGARRSAVVPAVGGDGASTTAAFLAWCDDKGVKRINGVGPGVFTGGLRGLACPVGADPAADLITVPLAAALRVIPGGEPLPPSLKGLIEESYYRKQPPEVCMALLLMGELRRGSQSDFSPYLAMLPTASDVDGAAGWSPADLAKLQYPALEADATSLGIAWSRLDADLCSPGGVGLAPNAAPFSSSDLLRSLQAAQSRLFSGPHSGRTGKDRLGLAAFVVTLAGAAIVSNGASITDVLNGCLSAVLFNLIYDALLSKKLKWYALLPLVDLANHASGAPSEASWLEKACHGANMGRREVEGRRRRRSLIPAPTPTPTPTL